MYLPSESLLVLGLSSGALVLMSALHALADTLFLPSSSASATKHPPLSPLPSAERDADGDGEREPPSQCAFAARAVAGDKMRRSASAAVFLVDRLDSGRDRPHSPTTASTANAVPSHVVTLEGHRGPITALCYPYLHNSRYDQAHLLSGMLLYLHMWISFSLFSRLSFF